ncbi:MAG: prepilin-type N-terminal cleavage/methylation domain-containing protein [Erysipelotrichaceae bacterium]
MSFIKNNEGFTLIEMLLALMITSFSILLLSQMLVLLTKIDLNDERAQDLLAIHQLRLLFLEFEEISVEDDQLSFIYHDQDCQLILDHGKVFKTIGHEIFFQKLKGGYFEETNKCVYLHYERKKEVKTLLGCIK